MKLIVFAIPERDGVVLEIAFICINLLRLPILSQMVNLILDLVIHRVGSCCLLIHVPRSTTFIAIDPVIIHHILLLLLQLLLLFRTHVL